VTDALKLITGSAHPGLARQVCSYIGVELAKAEISRFADGEISVEIRENIRGADVFVFQPTFAPAENLLELLIMLDAVRRASAWRVTAVIPYFGYARQDRKDRPRVPITAKLVANLITQAGAMRVLTMDLHSPQIQGFFDIPFDHLFAAPVLIEYFEQKELQDLVVVSPDIGSVKMARAFAKRLGAGLAIVDKRRPRSDVSEVVNLIGEVEGKTALIIDDVTTTGGTLVQAADAVAKEGARSVYAGITHGMFCSDALERIERSSIAELAVTDSVPHDTHTLPAKVRTLSIAQLLGEAVLRIHEEKSLSSLFV
jgi:ribose-phosphate pyrophosphokinase